MKLKTLRTLRDHSTLPGYHRTLSGHHRTLTEHYRTLPGYHRNLSDNLGIDIFK